jgi:hypothetical protein
MSNRDAPDLDSIQRGIDFARKELIRIARERQAVLTKKIIEIDKFIRQLKKYR